MRKLIIFLMTFFIISKNSNAELIDISQNDSLNIEKYIPTISSTFIPGSGQIINQDYLKGILFFTSIIALISIDIFYLNPTIISNEKNKTQNSLIEILFFTNRSLIPSLWLYNINDAYRKSFEKNIQKEESEFEPLSFNINLLSINF